MTNVARLQLSLSDIARLADVQRPVVSMWRQRPLASHDFPSPVGQVAGEERFDAREVADYLAATGRGNNPEATDDLVAYAKLTQVSALDEVTTVHGLSALLCLATMTDEPLGSLSTAELHHLARTADPDDSFLVREIAELGRDVETFAGHADDLASASYSPSAAFERLLRQQASSTYPGHAATTLAPAAQALVARTAIALAADTGADAPFFVDVTDSSGDLLLATTSAYAGELASSVATRALDSPMGRLARRRLRVHDVHRLDVVTDVAGDFVVPGGASETVVHVLQVPPAGVPGLSDLDVLDLVGNLVVQLSDDSRVVVIGPASALTDRPATAELDLARDAVIRGDRLRAAIRLPKALLPRSPRRALALWALGPAHPAVAVRDRWTAVADVSDHTLDASLVDAIVTDVVAAMTPDERSAKAGSAAPVAGTDEAEQVVGHQFRVARRVLTSSILPGRKSLVERAIRSRSTATGLPQAVEQAAAIERLIAQLGPSHLDDLVVEPHAVDHLGSTAKSQLTTVDQAVLDGLLRVIPGNRLESDHLTLGSEGRAVLGPAEIVSGATDGIQRIDLMTFAAHYPAGRLTEPGDVIVSTSPRVGAFVDIEGGSVVQSPARVLRITEAGRSHFLASVLALDVTAANGPSAGDWRRWQLRVLTDEAVDVLAATTATLDEERHELLARIAALDDLALHLIDGAASGALTITHTPSESPKTLAMEGP